MEINKKDIERAAKFVKHEQDELDKTRTATITEKKPEPSPADYVDVLPGTPIEKMVEGNNPNIPDNKFYQKPIDGVDEIKKFIEIQNEHEQRPISEAITNIFKEKEIQFYCNDNISEYISSDELKILETEVAENFDKLLRSLLIDVDNCHNTQGTAARVAKMFIHEVFKGRYTPEPTITAFPNVAYDGAYYTGPISIRSTCAHHFQNITGNCWVGIKPHKEVIGLSKFNRIVDHIASRPQIQEEMTVQIADRISELVETDNVGILIKAQHHCLTHRGVKEHDSDMTTTILRGTFQWDTNLRNEFFSTVNNMKGHS